MQRLDPIVKAIDQVATSRPDNFATEAHLSWIESQIGELEKQRNELDKFVTSLRIKRNRLESKVLADYLVSLGVPTLLGDLAQ